MKTDRDAVCRYSKTEGLQYPDLESVFSVTGGREHSSPLSDLADGTAYRFFAKCEVPGTECRNPHDLMIIFDVAAR